MKRLLYSLWLAVGAIVCSSCADYLDVDRYFYDQVSVDSAFSKRVYTEGWLHSAYNTMLYVGEFSEPFRWASDDLYHPDMKDYQEGNYSADNQLSDSQESESRLWKYYEGIRKASTFINNVDRCPELTMDERADMKAQVRFLRAYCYWGLIRVYGPVPLIPLEGQDVNLSYEELSLPRERFDVLVDFIDKELAEAARSLPTKRTVNNLGRPTRGAALGLRARVLLYAASPLFNGNTDLFNVKDCYGNQLVSQEYDENKWARAAAAAKDLIELSKNANLYELYTVAPKATSLPSTRPPYHEEYSNKKYPDGWEDVDPLLSYKSIFDGTILGSKNQELIFTRSSKGHLNINRWNEELMPKTLKGNNKLAVTQKMVDAYAMNTGWYPITGYEADGTPIVEPLSGYELASELEKSSWIYPSGGWSNKADFEIEAPNMYKDREPRFYVTVFFGGNQWLHGNSATSISFAKGGNGNKSHDYPKSGYLCNRFYDHKLNSSEGQWGNITFPVFRLGEIYLNFIEAVLECKKNGVALDPSYEALAMEKWADLRKRAGLDPITSIYGQVSTEELIQLCRKERQIELAFERHRYFDTRTWMIATQTDNGKMYGMNTSCPLDAGMKGTETPDGFWERTAFETRVFQNKHYLYPFSQRELDRKKLLTQN